MTSLVRSIARALAVASLLGILLVLPVRAAPEDDSRQVIDTFQQALLSVMKSADKLGYDGRYQALEPVIEKTFDIPLMTRIVVGAPWSTWTEDQRGEVTKAFERFITSTYARRFDGYGGEEFVIDGERPSNGGILVMTRIIRKGDDPVTLNYQFRDHEGEGSRVVDVFQTGTISELATRRSEFGAVLQHDGYAGLLKALADKAKG
jgi:phospholipid transport system substrate-binding protein